MLVLDTNLLVRIILQDDLTQAKKAERLIEETAGKKETLFVPDVIFSEMIWVLTSLDKIDKDFVIGSANALLGDVRFEFDHRDRLIDAVGLFQDHNVDFAEAYASAAAIEIGARGVASFDRDVRKLPVKWIQP